MCYSILSRLPNCAFPASPDLSRSCTILLGASAASCMSPRQRVFLILPVTGTSRRKSASGHPPCPMVVRILCVLGLIPRPIRSTWFICSSSHSNNHLRAILVPARLSSGSVLSMFILHCTATKILNHCCAWSVISWICSFVHLFKLQPISRHFVGKLPVNSLGRSFVSLCLPGTSFNQLQCEILVEFSIFDISCSTWSPCISSNRLHRFG